MEQFINVYIDGACFNNGQHNAKAGYGVYFGQDDTRNEYGAINGKQSNNTGELTAFIRSIEILENDIQKNTKIHIYTDSAYVIKCATTYGEKLELHDWKTEKGSNPPNLELLQKAYYLYKKAKHTVSLNKIAAHTGLTDEHSLGNEGADRLANLGAGKTVDDIEHSIIKLNISFSNKDKAKDLGARWDANNKYWYINTKYVKDDVKQQILELQDTQNVAPEPLHKTLNVHKKYVKISYANKNKAKSIGAKWDASVKSWYYVADELSQRKIQDLLALQ
jgi:ribonuclease HI